MLGAAVVGPVVGDLSHVPTAAPCPRDVGPAAAGVAPGPARHGDVVGAVEAMRRRCMVTGEQLLVQVVELDTLDALSRVHGTALAEFVVREAAERLRGATRRDDVVARDGERGFVVAQVCQSGQAPTLADRVARAVSQPSACGLDCPATLGSVTADTVAGDAMALIAAASAARVRTIALQQLADRLAERMPDRGQGWAGLLEPLTDGVLVLDPLGTILYHNAAMQPLLLGQGMAGTCPAGERDRPRWRGPWRAIDPQGTPIPAHAQPAATALAAGRTVADVVLGLSLPHGQLGWFSATAVPIQPVGSAIPAAVLATFREITGELATRPAFQDPARRVHQAIDAFPHAFFILDAERDDSGAVGELRFTHLTRAAARLLGCRVSDVIGRGLVELFPSVVELGIFEHHVLAIETGQPATLEVPWFDENGVSGSFELVLSPLGDSIVTTATEISERRTLVSQLAASEARFLSAFGNATMPMALVQVPAGSHSRTIVQVNASMCDFLGCTEDDLLGPVAPDRAIGLGRALADFDRLVESDNPRGVDCSFMLPSGGRRWGELRLSELGDPVAGSSMWLLQCTDTTEWHRIEDELLFNSQHDRLTGLPNRAMLIEKLGEHLGGSGGRKPLAVLVVNLDDFKSVNTELGFDAGDDYLRACGDLLESAVGDNGQVARLGGDEFAIMMTVGDSARLGATAEAILGSLARGVDLPTTVISAPASIGLAVAARGATPESVIAAASQAMRESKARGGNTWTMARPSRQAAHTILGIEADLRDAVTSGGLTLVFQPLFDLRTGRLESVEALTRWVHPVHGPIPPHEFIRIAERRNLIGLLGDWVLEAACTQWSDWRARHGVATPNIAVNVSTRQLGTRALARRVAALTDQFAMVPGALCLEITESQVLVACRAVAAELAELRHAGALIAVDDFGTGYAGFSYVTTLPADRLKIDRSFVDRVDSDWASAAVATSMVALGRGLGLQVVAEGIETIDQLAVMRALGADIGQGWLWRPALHPDDLEAIIGMPELQARRA